MSVKALCPDATMLKLFILGEIGAEDRDRVAEHIESCAECLAALKTRTADDTLVEAVRAQETLPENADREAVRQLVAKVRSLLPATGSPPELTVDAATQPISVPAHETQPLGGEFASGNEVEDEGFAPAQLPDEIGRLAGYRILKVLGVGGMGKVFLAEDSQLRRKVALKVMKPVLARNTKSRLRFLQEARLTAAIEHDHIVHIYQVGEDRGIPYLAMQLLNGMSLDDMLKQGTLKIKQVLRISIQIAEGLAAAHQQGLVHRDIKPANIWIEPTGGGRVKILDFGLARSAADEITLTQSGTIMGTPAYMPPEQARGDKVDHRCDLYSLGCVMYRMATGDLPIKGNDTMSMLMALAMNEPTPPAKLRGNLPESLSDLIMKLLAKEKDKRPGSAREVVAILKEIARSMGGTSSSEQSKVPTTSPEMTLPLSSAAGAKSENLAYLDTPAEKKSRPLPSAPKSPGMAKTNPKPSSKIAPPVKAEPAPLAKPHRNRMLALGGSVLAVGFLAGIVALGVVFFIPAANGVIRIEVDDPKVSFRVDDKGNYSIVGADNKEISFAAGEHTLNFKHGDIHFQTDKFQLKKNDRVVVKVEFLKGMLRVEQNEKILSERKIGREHPSTIASVPGTAIALRKGTWVPDTSVIALPGRIPHPALLKGVGRWQIIPDASPEAMPFAASPDGLWVAIWNGNYVHIHDAKTGQLSAVGKQSQLVGPLAGANPTVEWSPNSKWFRTGYKRNVGWDAVQIFSADGSISSAPWIQHAEVDFGWNPKHSLLACNFHGIRDRIQLVDPARAKASEIITNQGVGGKAVWSPDGEWLVVVREDQTGQLFGKNGNPGAKLDGTIDPRIAPVWSADSKTIAGLSGPNEVRFWKKSGDAGAICKHATPVKQLWWRIEGNLLAVAEDARLHFWKTDGKSEAVLNVPFDPTLRFVGSGFAAHGKLWPTLGKDSFALHGSVSPDGKSALIEKNRATGSLGMAEIQGDKIVDLDWHIPYVGTDTLPQFSADGKHVFVNDLDGLASYDVRDAKKVLRFGGPTAGWLIHAAFSPSGDRLAVGSAHGHITICDATGQPILAPWQPLQFSDDPARASVTHAGHFRQLDWHPDGRHLLAVHGGGDKVTVGIFDSVEGRLIAAASYQLDRFNPHFFALFAPDDADKIIFNHSEGSAIWRWKLEREPSKRFDGLLGPAYVSPDGKTLLGRLSGPQSLPVLVSSDFKSRTPLPAVPSFSHNAALAWLPDGKHFLAPHDGLAIHSLDGKLVERIKPVPEVNTNDVGTLILSPDRKTFLGGNENQFFLLDVADKKLTPLREIRASNLVFSPDGKYLVGTSGSTLRYWNRDTKNLEQIVLMLPDRQFAIFSPAGEVLARSKNAEQHYRYLIEDRTGRLRLATPAEFANATSPGSSNATTGK